MLFNNLKIKVFNFINYHLLFFLELGGRHPHWMFLIIIILYLPTINKRTNTIFTKS